MTDIAGPETERALNPVGERPFFEPGQPRTPTKIVERQAIDTGSEP
ncbi:hypothetical protein [Rhizobium binxianense]|jgi:hypothetical protein